MPPKKSRHRRSEAKRVRTRKPAPVPEPPQLPLELMSDAEELALALVLWKSLRCHGALVTGHGTGAADMPTDESVRLGDRAIKLAKKVGVKDEFFALLFKLKLVKVTLAPME